jgi:hypothetical protein
MSVESELMEAVSKHLPAMQMEALRKELSKVASLEALAKSLAKEKETVEGRLDAKTLELDRLKNRVGGLEGREKEVADREASARKRDIDMAIADHKVQAANREKDMVVELARIMFGNKRVWKETWGESKTIPIPGGPGRYGTTQTVSEGGSKTVEKG